MAGDNGTAVCQAIRERRLLAIEYGGTHRLVQPHVYGDDHAGHRLLSAYQVSGDSASGASRGWKSFRMDRVGSVVLTTERFHGARTDYQRDDGAFARVLCQL
ncbi:hypothetical protein [Luteibacter sp. ME-Dv--P-043b]|uniref:hypothetical protein n=1 Tax=unclassified Luteibacter TaxID=2620188 RepID=UPI002555AD74|nr:hypothetical protein [Luteibacter sp. ME-Dv--P-043b]